MSSFCGTWDVPFVPAVWNTPCVKRLACVNLFSLQQKNRPVLCRGRGDSSFGLMQPGLCETGDELLEHVGHLDERTDRDEFVDAVIAIAAGGKVGAGQTAERQLRAVGAAANRQHLGSTPQAR